MFSLLSAPYLLHINVKLNFIIHKLIEAKHFYGTSNTFEHIEQIIIQSAQVHASPKKVRFIIFFAYFKTYILYFPPFSNI